MSSPKLHIKKREPGGYHHPQAAQLTAELAKEEGDKVRLNVEISKPMRQALKARAATEGRTIADIVNELIRAYLETKT